MEDLSGAGLMALSPGPLLVLLSEEIPCFSSLMGYAEHIPVQGREPPGELEPGPSVDPEALGRGGMSGEHRRQDDHEADSSSRRRGGPERGT